MIAKFEIHGVHANVDDRLKGYTSRKIGGLDKYVAKKNRDSLHADVHLKIANGKGPNNAVCEVTLHLPHQTIVIKERALNLYAAVDITEAKIKQQLQKYKDMHGRGLRHRFYRRQLA